MSTVSIIMATYKRPELLEVGLYSLTRHKYKHNIEIVVVNDGVHDATESICKKYGAKYIFSGQRNVSGKGWSRGPGFALNIGVKQCTGDYIILTCPEIYHVNDCLGTLLANIDKTNTLLTSECMSFDDEGTFTKSIINSLKVNKVVPIGKVFGTLTLIADATEMPFFLGMWKKSFMSIGGYDEDFTGYAGEDSDLMQRLLSAGAVYKRLDMPIIHLYHGKRCDGHRQPDNPAWVHNWEIYQSKKGILYRNVGRRWGMLKKRVVLVYLNAEKNISMGAGYIATVIIKDGHDLTFIDTAYTSVDQTIQKIIDGKFDLVLLSATTLFYKDAVKIADAVKKAKASEVLLGGIHATIMKENILNESPSIDYICVGEGEAFILEFLDKYKTPFMYDIKNLGYRKDGVATLNTIREATNLATLPQFNYDIFQNQSIVVNPPYAPKRGFCYVFSTRGCPYACAYCCNTMFLSLYKKSFLRKRNIDDVIAELKYLKANHGAEFFYFGDEMILFDKEHVTELFTRVRDEVGSPYGCMARVEHITPETVELFRSTGCGYVGMGIECGDEEFRKNFLNRHMTNAQIIEAFRLLRTIPNIMLTSYNMRGYPVPYDAELTEKTRQLNAIVNPDIMQMSLFFPFPGTKLHDYCVEHDLIDKDKLENITEYFSKSVLKEF